MFTNRFSASLMCFVAAPAIYCSGISGAGSEATILMCQLMLLVSLECIYAAAKMSTLIDANITP